MITPRTTRWALVTSMTVLFGMHEVRAEPTFRGIPKDQGDNLLYSDSLNRLTDLGKPYYVDIRDAFARDGQLIDSHADTLRIGFVPPVSGLPDGPLMGEFADAHGRWTATSSDYLTTVANGGRVHRDPGSGIAVASTPWRVDPGLGDYYHIEMTAAVAAGEKVSLGYLGNIDTYGAVDGLAGQLGQLVLGIERGVGDEDEVITSTVTWYNGDVRTTWRSTLEDPVPVGEELNIQLGWLDQGTNDLLDAWLGTSGGNERLTSWEMQTAIDVYAVGFELSGGGSYVSSFTSAVPEPAAGMLMLLSVAGLIATRRGD